MGPDLTGPELVAAVSNAGGFGILQAQLCPPQLLRDQITYLRTLTDKPFGVNFILHFPHHAGIQVCIDERVAALSFFWGDPSEFVAPAHDAGIAVLHQVGSVEAAVRAEQRGVDVIIAQGIEELRPADMWPVRFPPWCFCLASWMRLHPHLSWPPEVSPTQEDSRLHFAWVPTAS
jgi:hypothetical protein